MTTNKPKVRRYDCTSGGFQYCYGCYTMREDELGDYVEWEAYEALQAECERLRGLLRDTASVAITMLYDSHKADVLAEFKVPELEAVVDASKHLQSHRVEHVYRRAWDAAIDAAMQRIGHGDFGG